MIITCEKCSTKFNLNESLLKENGSKVRCCLCQHVFTAYPPVKKKKDEIRGHVHDQSVLPEFKKPLVQHHEPMDDSDGEGKIDVNSPNDDIKTENETNFEDNLDLDFNLDLDIEDEEDEENLDLNFDFDDDFIPEPGLELEDIDVKTDFENSSKEAESGEKSSVDDSTEFDFFPDENSESENNLEMDSQPDSEFDFDLEPDLELESDLELEPDVEPDLELESNDKEIDEFDEKLDSGDDFDFGNQDIEDDVKNGSLISEENFELELDLEDDDEPLDSLEFEDPEAEPKDVNFQNDDIGGEKGEEDTIELDFSEFDEEFEDLSDEPSDHEDLSQISTDEKTEFENKGEEPLLSDKADDIEKPVADVSLSDSAYSDSTEIPVDTKQEKLPEQKKLPEHEEIEESSLGAIPEGFESNDEFKKPVKKPGKAIFVILILAILILAGYSITIMKGINIPYVSNFKIPFLTQYLASNTHVKPILGSPIPDKKSINGKFITNSSAGTLFVITGKIINKSTIPCSHVKVTGTLITKDKIKVKKKTVFCGNFISEDKLGSLKIKAIDSILAKKSGSNSSNVKITPGRSVPFMIVFSKLPDNLQNFTVNVAGFDKGNIKK